MPQKIDEKALLNDPSTTSWLKRAIEESHNRDILDALHDAEVLVRVLEQRFEQVVRQGHGIIVKVGIGNG